MSFRLSEHLPSISDCPFTGLPVEILLLNPSVGHGQPIAQAGAGFPVPNSFDHPVIAVASGDTFGALGSYVRLSFTRPIFSIMLTS